MNHSPQINSKPEDGRKRLFSTSNIITGLLLLLVAAMFIFPDVKAVMMRGLMKVGLFQPHVPGNVSQVITPASAAIEATTFIDAQGNHVSLESLKGKVVLLNFWATWCPPCRAEMPSLDGLYRKLNGDSGIVFLAVDADGKPASSQAFLDKHDFAIPLAIPGGVIPHELFEGTLPTTVVLDRMGNIVMRHSGAADFSSKAMEQFLRGLMKP